MCCATRLLPTITVIATQVGYLIGGLVVVEVLFHYQGIGSLIFTAARGKDFPMLEAGVLTIGIIYTIATLSADTLYSLLNPRIRFGVSRMSATMSARSRRRAQRRQPAPRADARAARVPAPSWPG